MSSLNLLGSYGGGSDDSDAEEVEDFECVVDSKSNAESDDGSAAEDPEPTGAFDGTDKPATNIKSILLGGAEDDSEDEDEAGDSGKLEEVNPKKPESKQSTSRRQLAPSFDPRKCTDTGCSVFMNEQKREEMLNQRILSQHVSLTEYKQEDASRKKMGPCRAFKRGECRRGDKCRFWHATPGQTRVADPSTGAVVSSGATYYTSEPDAFKKRKLN